MFVFVFSSNSRLFNFTRILFLHLRGPFFRLFSSLPPSSSLQPSSQPSLELTLVHPFEIKNEKSKCDILVLSGDKWREKKFLLSDKSA